MLLVQYTWNCIIFDHSAGAQICDKEERYFTFFFAGFRPAGENQQQLKGATLSSSALSGNRVPDDDCAESSTSLTQTLKTQNSKLTYPAACASSTSFSTW